MFFSAKKSEKLIHDVEMSHFKLTDFEQIR